MNNPQQHPYRISMDACRQILENSGHFDKFNSVNIESVKMAMEYLQLVPIMGEANHRLSLPRVNRTRISWDELVDCLAQRLAFDENKTVDVLKVSIAAGDLLEEAKERPKKDHQQHLYEQVMDPQLRQALEASGFGPRTEMSFDQFRGTRRQLAGGAYFYGHEGELYIQDYDSDGNFSLHIENNEWLSEDLTRLERQLFDWAQGEGPLELTRHSPFKKGTFSERAGQMINEQINLHGMAMLGREDEWIEVYPDSLTETDPEYQRLPADLAKPVQLTHMMINYDEGKFTLKFAQGETLDAADLESPFLVASLCGRGEYLEKQFKVLRDEACLGLLQGQESLQIALESPMRVVLPALGVDTQITDVEIQASKNGCLTVYCDDKGQRFSSDEIRPRELEFALLDQAAAGLALGKDKSLGMG